MPSPKQQLAIVIAYLSVVTLGSFANHSSIFGSEGSHYFAKRSNFLNQYFVKLGWFWFTLVFWLMHFNLNKTTNINIALKRYLLATVGWIFYSQWFFGAPLMDRIFKLTGGECHVAHLNTNNASIAREIANSATSFVCRRSGGLWLGGHDPSGHVFILVLSSFVLLLEVWPNEKRNWRHYMVYSLLSLWAFMLFMTSVYFHTFGEKISGFVFAVVFARIISGVRANIRTE